MCGSHAVGSVTKRRYDGIIAQLLFFVTGDSTPDKVWNEIDKRPQDAFLYLMTLQITGLGTTESTRPA
ncbi:MAG: hypothetical protein PWR07_2252 [Bacillota bacterium]|nr:hypothetical protein [Bacillota bacterium]